jgi:hypothetical protein
VEGALEKPLRFGLPPRALGSYWRLAPRSNFNESLKPVARLEQIARPISLTFQYASKYAI